MKRTVALAAIALAACDRPTAPFANDSAPSPAASIFPSPLAPAETEAVHPAPTRTTPATTATSPKKADPASSGPRAASSVPVTPEPSAAPPIRFDETLDQDALGAKETLGVALTVELRWPDAPGATKGGEVSIDGESNARKLAAFRWDVVVTEAGRLRIVFDSRSFPVPLGSELRARIDRLGHVLVFPNGTDVRPVPPGALRAMFGDRRLDVVPLVAAGANPKGTTAPRFGFPTHRIDVSSRMGTVALEVAHVPEAGLGAMLLCRTLVELVAVDPQTGACVRDELPLRATYSWPGGGSFAVDAIDLAKKTDFPVSDLAVPPPSATFAPTPLPLEPGGAFLTREELAAFRTRAVDVLPTAGAPPEGLLARNATDSIRYLLLDGVAIGWFGPNTDQAILGLPRGHYLGQWRSFLGDAIEPARTVDVPARFAAGEPPPAPIPIASSPKK